MGDIRGGEISPPSLSASPPPVSPAGVDSVVVVVVGAAECLMIAGTGDRRIDRAESVCLSRSRPSSSISTKGS